MIPLALVTGFLGSGKTTFLQHASRRLAVRRVVFLVNDFSPLDVDGELVASLGPDTVAIPGGSIFCRCLVGEFIARLQELPQRFGAEGAVEGVIVEASGMADPRVVEKMLAETRLDGVYRLAPIVTVLDPGSLGKLLATLPNIRAQIEAADVVLLNKADLYDEQALADSQRRISEIRPDVPVIRTVRAEADVDLLAPRGQAGLAGDYAPCADPNYSRTTLVFERPVDLPALTRALEGLGEGVYRAKGFVPTPEGMVYVDFSQAGLQTHPHRGTGAAGGLALITAGQTPPTVKDLASQVRAGRLYAPTPG